MKLVYYISIVSTCISEINSQYNQQKYLIAQLKDLSVKANKLRADLDQVQRAADSFQKELLESFKQVAEETIEKDTEKAS